MSDAETLGLPAHAFDRQDDGTDLQFYAPARLVTHIDEGAVFALSAFYRAVIPAGARVLDLMSSWVSHLPDDIDYDVVGHGMNPGELAANPRLGRWFVQDLNRAPTLPEPAATFDAVLVCVGVQYLQQPLSVLVDVRRALQPGGTIIVSFSNRFFPTKAVAIWRALGSDGRAALVGLYLEAAGFSAVETHVLADGRSGDPMVAVTGRA